MTVETKTTKTQALRALATTQMCDFTDADWQGFAGCETENPMIGFCDIGGTSHVLVLDGESFLVMAIGDITGGIMYNLEDDR